MSSEGILSREKINFVIFGGTGNLSRKKLLPAIYELYKKGKIYLKEILLLSRKEEKFREIASSFPEDFRKFLKFVKFFVEKDEGFRSLELPLGLTVFYLALPPSLFKRALEGIGKHLNVKNKRIVVEKPFGLDLKSAKELNGVIDKYFSEGEIFRIDHFLGKPQVQNILSFKFSNFPFERLFSSEFVERVEILALEKEGVEGREAYYEEVGALKDMVQNHILLLCTLTAMEAPPNSKELVKERERTLKFFRKLSEEKVLRFFRKGRYREYKGRVETYAEGVFFVDNARWRDVPFFFKTGKRLGKKRTEVRVLFKNTPKAYLNIFDCEPNKNILTFKLFPELSVELTVNLISPKGFLACNESAVWKVDLKEVLGEVPSPYESLLLAVLEGDRRFFIGREEVILLWEVIEPILKVWNEVEEFVY